MEKVLLVFVGGGLGAVSRYGTTLLAGRLWGAAFPWGTLIVNLVGCFLIGMAFALVEEGRFGGPSLRLFFMTGFLGGLTTFSTYSLECVTFAQAGVPWTTLANLAVNNAGGLALVLAGMWVVRVTVLG